MKNFKKTCQELKEELDYWKIKECSKKFNDLDDCDIKLLIKNTKQLGEDFLEFLDGLCIGEHSCGFVVFGDNLCDRIPRENFEQKIQEIKQGIEILKDEN